MEKIISIIYDGVITNINILFLLYFQQRSYETIPKVHFEIRRLYFITTCILFFFKFRLFSFYSWSFKYSYFIFKLFIYL